MAITSSGSFVTANNKTAGTTFQFTASSAVSANDLAILFIATDNLTTSTASNDVLSVVDNSVINTNFILNAGSGFDNKVHAIVTQSDGKIVLAGEFTSYSGSSVNRIVRINNSGSIDDTFNIGTGFDGPVYSLAIQASVTGSGGVISDKIIAVGAFTQYSGSNYSGSVRIHPSGSVDTNFNIGSGFNGNVLTVAVESTSSYTSGGNNAVNKLIFGGTFTTYSGSSSVGIVKVLANGNREATSSFNPGAGFTSNTDVRDIKILNLGGTGVAAWSTSGTVTAGKDSPASFGTKDSGMVTMGLEAGASTQTSQCYNGSTWAATPPNTGVAMYAAAGAGNYSSGKTAGGKTGANAACACVFDWSGTAWSTACPLTTARSYLGMAGSQASALVWAGEDVTAAFINTTEEWDGGIAWAAGGTFPASTAGTGGAGTSNATLSPGGANPSWNCTYCYNGASSPGTWTTLAPATIHYERRLSGTFGTYNCALSIGGFAFAPSTNCVQTWNGTTWAAGCNTLEVRAAFGRGGYLVTNAGFISHGRNDTATYITTSENWSDGTDASGESRLFVGGDFTSYSGSIRCRLAVINARTGLAIPTASFNIGTAGFNNAVNSLFLEPSTNKLLATGQFTSYSGSSVSRIARINISGSIDSGSNFNSGAGLNDTGSVIFSYTSGSTPVILVGGAFTQYSGSTVNGLVRILNSGSIDTNFDEGGFTSNTLVENLIVESNGKIILVGDFTQYSGSYEQDRIARLKPDGTIDATFSNGGTWIKVSERGGGTAANAGPTIALFYKNTGATPLPVGTQITASLSGSITAKAATGWAFNYDSAPITSSGTSSYSATLPLSLTLSGLTSRQYLFVRGFAHEGPSTDAFTPTSTWTAFTSSGTTGAAAASNMSVAGEWIISTATSATSNPTYAGSTDNSSVMWSFFEFVSGTKTYFILLD